MIEVFVCEDSVEQRLVIEQTINNYIMIEELDMRLCLSSGNPQDILDYLEENIIRKSVFFLDIDLKHDIDGIQLGSIIRKKILDAKIIYVTTHGDMQPVTFEHMIEAMDYFAKDDPEIMKNRICESLKRANRYYTSEEKVGDSYIKIRVGNQIRVVSVAEIMFFETSPISHKLILHLENALVDFYGKLSDIEKMSKSFKKVHKSFVVNQDNIVAIDLKEHEIKMKNGEVCIGSIRMLKKLDAISNKN